MTKIISSWKNDDGTGGAVFEEPNGQTVVSHYGPRDGEPESMGPGLRVRINEEGPESVEEEIRP